MYTAHTVKPGVYRYVANLEEEDLDLFEGIWPIPHGVSLNSYFVQGDKGALIDLVCDWDGTPVKIVDQMKETSFSVQDVDYVVLNHMEPDHTSWLPHLCKENPRIVVYCTEKASKLVKAFYGLDNCKIVKSGDHLDLGQGKVLHFLEVPNVHWPETMVTYEPSSKVLFTCDAFGSFGRVEEAVYDDQLKPGEKKFFDDEMLRYYANIVASFSVFVQRAIKKVVDTGWTIEVIAPAHGIIYRTNPMDVIQRYITLAQYLEGPCEPEITLIWSSMYGNTEKVVDSIIEGVRSEGVGINIFRVPQDHVSFILGAAWKSSALILGMPTYEYKMFPPMANVLDMFSRKHVHYKKVLRFGSFGWSGGAQKELDHLTKDLHWSFAEPLEWQGRPDEEVKKRAFEAAKALAKEVKAGTWKGKESYEALKAAAHPQA